jgi:hypothetical protein
MTFDVAHQTRQALRRPSRGFAAMLFGCMLAVLGIALSPAAGAAAPAITVSPSSGLSDGQSVTVHGSGYSANVKTINVIQCPVSGAGQNSCNVPDAKLFQSTDGSGSFTVQLVVRAKLGSIDCTKVACMIDAHEGTSATSGNDASVVLHFGSVPVTRTSSAPAGGGSGSGSSGGNTAAGSGTSGTGASTPGSGKPTGADTGFQDVGTPRIALTLGLIGLGVVLLLAGTAVHLRRRTTPH